MMSAHASPYVPPATWQGCIALTTRHLGDWIGRALFALGPELVDGVTERAGFGVGRWHGWWSRSDGVRQRLALRRLRRGVVGCCGDWRR